VVRHDQKSRNAAPAFMTAARGRIEPTFALRESSQSFARVRGFWIRNHTRKSEVFEHRRCAIRGTADA